MNALLTKCLGDPVQTGTGKVDLARKFKCTSSACELVSLIVFLYILSWSKFSILWEKQMFPKLCGLRKVRTEVPVALFSFFLMHKAQKVMIADQKYLIHLERKNWTKIVSSVTNTPTAQFFSGTPYIYNNKIRTCWKYRFLVRYIPFCFRIKILSSLKKQSITWISWQFY